MCDDIPGHTSAPVSFRRERLNLREPHFYDGELGRNKKAVKENEEKNQEEIKELMEHVNSDFGLQISVGSFRISYSFSPYLLS